MNYRDRDVMPDGKRILTGVAGAIAAILLIWLPMEVFESTEAKEVVVLQSYFDGKLTIWRTPGLHYSGFGSITSYPMSEEFRFMAQKDDKGHVVSTKDCIQTTFNDKGVGWVCGQVSFDMPTDDKLMAMVHQKYGSVDSVKDRIIKASMVKAVSYSGPLMSSKESTGSRRGDLISYMQDQATQGIYRTEEVDTDVEDLTVPPIEKVEIVEVPVVDTETGKVKLDANGQPITTKEGHARKIPQTRKVKVFVPVKKDGVYEVREHSVAKELGIPIYNFTIDVIVYEDKVKEQINAQRDMEMQIQTKIAEAETAKQDALTAQSSGLAAATKARWEQEVLKAKAQTVAEQAKAVALTGAAQAKEVAEQDLQTARLQKEAAITRAEGESKARSLAMQADGALDKKLLAWVDVNKAFAEQVGKQRWVPDVVMGGGDSKGGPGLDILQLFAAKTAAELQLDMQQLGARTGK